MRRIQLIVTILLLLLTNPSFGQDILETNSQSLTIENSTITSIYDKTRGQEYIAYPADKSFGLFSIQLIKNNKPFLELNTKDFTLQKEQSKKNTITLIYENETARVTVSINLIDSDKETSWDISIRLKDTAIAVGRVDFPQLQLNNNSSEKLNPYYFVFPTAEGRKVSPQNKFWKTYPADLAAQLAVYCAPQASFILWTDDNQGHVKTFGFESIDKNSVLFEVQHRMPYINGKDWDMPYKIRMAFCGKEWQSAANVYRQWHKNQLWSKTKFKHRTDMPDFLHSPPLCITSDLTTENDLNLLEQNLLSYRNVYNVPIIYTPFGWEKYEKWIGIDYFPVSIGNEVFHSLAAKLEKQQIYICGFISGYKWAYSAPTYSNDPSLTEKLADYYKKNQGWHLSEKKSSGKPNSRTLDGMQQTILCRGTDFGEEFFPKTASTMLDLGFKAVHFDQDNIESLDGINGCYDISHNHPIPCGTWSTKLITEAFKKISASAKKQGINNLLLTREWGYELLNMHIHGQQIRNYNIAINPDLMPLVQYLYHEYLPAMLGSVTAKDKDIRMLAAQIIYGQIPSLGFFRSPAESIEMLPPQTKLFLNDYYSAIKTFAKDYLLYGKMLAPIIPDIPVINTTVNAAKHNQGETAVEWPLVLQSAWEDENGNIGIFAVNLQKNPFVVTCPVPEGCYPQAKTYIGGNIDNTLDTSAADSIKWELFPERLQSILFLNKKDTRNLSTAENTLFSLQLQETPSETILSDIKNANHIALICAHPDDEILIPGLLSLSTHRYNKDVYVISLSNTANINSMPPGATQENRKRDNFESKDFLKLKDYIRFSTLKPLNETDRINEFRAFLRNFLIEKKIDLVITLDTVQGFNGNPQHIKVSKMVTDLMLKISENKSTLNLKLYYSINPNPDILGIRQNIPHEAQPYTDIINMDTENITLLDGTNLTLWEVRKKLLDIYSDSIKGLDQQQHELRKNNLRHIELYQKINLIDGQR